MKKWKISYTLTRKSGYSKSFILSYAVDEESALEKAMLTLFHELQALKQLSRVSKVEIDQIEEVTNA